MSAPSMKSYVIGIDYGTDSCRALIVDAATGAEIVSAVSPYKRWAKGLYCAPAANRYRQHPSDYIESLEESVREALSQIPAEDVSAIRGICFDTTGSTPVLTDADGTPLALLPEFAEDPDAMFVLWKDHTAIAEAEEITALAKKSECDYTAYSGGTYSSEWAWAKVLHILRGNAEIARKAYSWIEHCDWMPALVTDDTRPGHVVRSRCAAGHKSMWNETWGGLPPKEFFDRLDPALGAMRPRLSDKTYTSDTRAGKLSAEWAARLGLSEEVEVAAGIIDAHAGAVGSCAAPSVLTRIIGTSTCDILIIDKREAGDNCIKGICGQVDGSVVPGYIGIEAGQSAFGDIYAWFRELLTWPLRFRNPAEDIAGFTDEIIPLLTREAEKILPTESSPVALDWMNGRRTPYADQNLKGALCNITLGTTAPMIFRALVEATAFGSKAIIEHLQKQGVALKSVHATGGIAQKSPFVMQVLSDVLEMPIRVVRSRQACALGAAMFAAVAAGAYETVEEAQQKMGSGYSAEYTPNRERAAVYGKLYENYRLLGDMAETWTGRNNG